MIVKPSAPESDVVSHISDAIEIESGKFVELKNNTHFKSMSQPLKKMIQEANQQIELSPDKLDQLNDENSPQDAVYVEDIF